MPADPAQPMTEEEIETLREYLDTGVATKQTILDRRRLLATLDSARAALARAEGERDTQRATVTYMQTQLERRNRELDALHYVWCDGGCRGGVHRFGEHPPLTKELVEEAVRNTQRLCSWYGNAEFSTFSVKDRMDFHEGFDHVKKRIADIESRALAAEALSERRRVALEKVLAAADAMLYRAVPDYGDDSGYPTRDAYNLAAEEARSALTAEGQGEGKP